MSGIAKGPKSDMGNTIAMTMRYLRKQMGLSLPEMEKRTGLKRGTLQTWESGRSEPRASELVKIAEALGTSIDVLVGNGDHHAATCTACKGVGMVWEKKEEKE